MLFAPYTIGMDKIDFGSPIVDIRSGGDNLTVFTEDFAPYTIGGVYCVSEEGFEKTPWAPVKLVHPTIKNCLKDI